MLDIVTADQVEKLAMQLPLQEQLRIVAQLSRRLSEHLSLETNEERRRKEYARQVEAFLKMSDELAAETNRAVDSAADIRQMRDERMARL